MVTKIFSKNPVKSRVYRLDNASSSLVTPTILKKPVVKGKTLKNLETTGFFVALIIYHD